MIFGSGESTNASENSGGVLRSLMVMLIVVMETSSQISSPEKLETELAEFTGDEAPKTDR